MKKERVINNKNYRERVFNIVGNKLNLSPLSLEDNDTYKSLGADSLDVIEMVMEYEQEFNFAISDDEVEKIMNHDLKYTIDYIETNA